jgi:hypothetical protein
MYLYKIVKCSTKLTESKITGSENKIKINLKSSINIKIKQLKTLSILK